MAVEIRTCTADELRAFLRPTAVTLTGRAPDPARFGRFASMDPARMHAAVEDGEIVASAGAFTFELTAPGPRAVAAAGVSVVGVLPSRRRRGLLRRLVDAQFDDARARREPVAILWSSETTIYGRFGYGIASEIVSVRADPRDLALVREAPPGLRSDLLDLAEAVGRIPPIYDRAGRSVPGMLSRNRVWWERRRLADDPALPDTMLRVVVGDDGGDRAYALLRIHGSWAQGRPQHELEVIEALGEDDAWTLEAWRFLLGVDLVRTLEAELMSVDHPLFLAVRDAPRTGTCATACGCGWSTFRPRWRRVDTTPTTRWSSTWQTPPARATPAPGASRPRAERAARCGSTPLPTSAWTWRIWARAISGCRRWGGGRGPGLSRRSPLAPLCAPTASSRATVRRGVRRSSS